MEMLKIADQKRECLQLQKARLAELRRIQRNILELDNNLDPESNNGANQIYIEEVAYSDDKLTTNDEDYHWAHFSSGRFEEE